MNWTIEPAIEFDETLAIPTCDTALPTRPLYCDGTETTDSHLLQVYTFEQRLVPRLIAQAAELQQMVRVTLLLSHSIFELILIKLL